MTDDAPEVDEMLVKVANWVESSGRALELRVARSMRRNGADSVELSFTYEDPQQGVQREGDVLAKFAWQGLMSAECAIELVAECKSGTSKPWVAFSDGRLARPGDLHTWAYFAHGTFDALTVPLSALWEESRSFLVSTVATHVVTAHGGDNNPAADAVRQVLSATEARRMDYISSQSSARRARVIIPVVVTAAPLVACRLGRDDRVVLESVDRFVVTGRRASDRSACRVYVMNEEVVRDFARDLADCARLAFEHAESQA